VFWFQFVVDHTLTEGSPAYERVMVFLVNGSIITHCMCYFNSAINPIIYYFMSAQFKVSRNDISQNVFQENQNMVNAKIDFSKDLLGLIKRSA
jgi:hypothetical protein